MSSTPYGTNFGCRVQHVLVAFQEETFSQEVPRTRAPTASQRIHRACCAAEVGTLLHRRIFNVALK
eukprot:2079949-Amphidinium_carterae.1